MKKMIKTFLLISLCFSCNLNNDGYDSNQVKDIEISSNLNQFDEKLLFLKQIKKICKTSNKLNEFDVDSSKLSNMRVNYLQSFTFWDYDDPYTFITDKFIISQIYDTTYNATIGNYGYIFATNGLIVNKTQNELYYMLWKNKSRPGSFFHTSHLSSTVDSTTYIILTNLDTALVRKTFNYKAKFDTNKIKSIILDFDQDKDGDFFEKYEIISKVD